jgi:hypothetical protein
MRMILLAAALVAALPAVADMGVGPHGENAREFGYMVEGGMPAAEALQSATYRAAEVLGENDLGQVAFVMKDGVVYRAP